MNGFINIVPLILVLIQSYEELSNALNELLHDMKNVMLKNQCASFNKELINKMISMYLQSQALQYQLLYVL